jgi:hypothetical protein
MLKSRFLGALGIVAVVGAVAGGSAAQTPAEAWGAPVEGIRLRLVVSQNAQSAASDDLPPLELQLRNEGNKSVTFAAYDVSCPSIDLEIDGVLSPREPYFQSGSSSESPLTPGATSELMPLKSFSAANGRCGTFKRIALTPGKHRVRAKVDWGVYLSPTHERLSVLFSNFVTITAAASPDGLR